MPRRPRAASAPRQRASEGWTLTRRTRCRQFLPVEEVEAEKAPDGEGVDSARASRQR
jgi:hypothetical protein